MESPVRSPLSLISRIASILLVVISIVMVSHSAINWWPYTCDDAYITCRYADNLAAGNGPVFNVGEKVEGYSSPCSVFFLGFISRIGGDPVIASKVLGLLAAMVLPVLCFFLVSYRTGNALLGGITAVLLASIPELHFYMCSGMETVPFALAIAAGITLISLRPSHAALQIATVLTILIVAFGRPEGLLLGPALFAAAFLLCRDRRCRAWLLVFVALMITFVAARWSYYGTLLPNTYLAKPSPVLNLLTGTGTGDTWAAVGSRVLPDTGDPTGLVRAFGSVVLGALVLLGMARSTTHPLGIACSVSIVVGAVYLIYCPEDWMPGRRFAFPFVFPALVLCAGGISTLWKHRFRRYARAFLIMAVAAFGLVVGANHASIADHLRSYRSGQANTALHSTRYVEIGKWLKSRASPGDRVLAYEIGALGYYSQLAVIDHEGLIDRYVAEQISLAGSFSEIKRGWNAPVMWNVVRYCVERRPTWFLVRSRGDTTLEIGKPVPMGVSRIPIQNAFLTVLGSHMVLSEVFPMRPSGDDYYLLLRRR